MFKNCAKINAFKPSMPKKRYIFGAILAVELASLPVAAQMVQNAVFTNRAYVTAVEVPSTESGLSRFLVVSNGPFTVRSENMIGDIDISIHQSGDINGKRFGDNAQLPGAGHSCAMVADSDETIIYQADRKTAVAKGETLSQAVYVELVYDQIARPDISFTADTSIPAPIANNCDIA